MAPGAGGGGGRSAAGRRDGGPVSASGAAGARCAVFASQAISGNDTPEQERDRLAGTCVALPRMERISDPVSTCIRRGRGRREGDLHSRPFGLQGAACLSEVKMRIGGVILVIWLIIGAIAAGQRGYYGSSPESRAPAGTIVGTVAAGPRHFIGRNPHLPLPLPFPSPKSAL